MIVAEDMANKYRELLAMPQEQEPVKGSKVKVPDYFRTWFQKMMAVSVTLLLVCCIVLIAAVQNFKSELTRAAELSNETTYANRAVACISIADRGARVPQPCNEPHVQAIIQAESERPPAP